MRFTKMHGCGNDYVFIDAWEQELPLNLEDLSRRLSDRHRGVGSDGLIIIAPPQSTGADLAMRMFNADGSESEMCGNGIRCAARLAFEHNRITGQEAQIETGGGVRGVSCLLDADGVCRSVRVDMGAPILEASKIPVLHDGEPGIPIDVDLGEELGSFALIPVGMGNPHAVCFVEDAEIAPVKAAGLRIEHNQLFPHRCNVEFVSQLAGQDGEPSLRLRTWERGSGETEACGTGACAGVVAGVLAGQLSPGRALVQLNGGRLEIEWDGQGPVWMTGEAVKVFEGELSAETLPQPS